jgi:hypothetical protein
LLLLLALLATARLEAGEDGRVRVSYDLELPERVSVLGFSAFEASPIEDLSATLSGENLVLTEERAGDRLSGTLELPRDAGSPITLQFHYRVRGSRIPLIVLDVDPGRARNGAFTARVELPEGAEAVSEFPSNGARDAAGALTWELPVLPAFVSWGRPPEIRREAIFPGSFWSLFAVNAAIVLLYVVWMRRR